MLISLFCFLQNSSARSCHISNIAKYHAVTIKKSEKKRKQKFLRKKEVITKTWILNERKVYLKKKGKVHTMIFLDKVKGDIKDFWQ